MSHRKDMLDLISDALEAGWSSRHTGTGHVQLRAPGGDGIVLVSSTPRDARAVRNARAQLRRLGLAAAA
jgi:hypothetical protein